MDSISLHPYSFKRVGETFEPADSRPHAMDVRIVLTVIDILRTFFQKNENAMIMVCDNADGKEFKRRKLRHDNPQGNRLRDAFYDLMKQDIYEIVI